MSKQLGAKLSHAPSEVWKLFEAEPCRLNLYAGAHVQYESVIFDCIGLKDQAMAPKGAELPGRH